jgi:hypothetical protein
MPEDVKARKRERNRRWYEANREQVLAQQREYKATRKEAHARASRRYRKRHANRIRTLAGRSISPELSTVLAWKARQAIRAQQLRDAAATREDHLIELMLRTAVALDAAATNAETASSRAAFSEAYARYRSAEDAVRHALGLAYDETIAT